MAVIALKHLTQHLQRHNHRRLGVDVHRALDVCHILQLEGLVSRNDTCAVNQNIHIAALLLHLLVRSLNRRHVGYIYAVALNLA